MKTKQGYSMKRIWKHLVSRTKLRTSNHSIKKNKIEKVNSCKGIIELFLANITEIGIAPNCDQSGQYQMLMLIGPLLQLGNTEAYGKK